MHCWLRLPWELGKLRSQKLRAFHSRAVNYQARFPGPRVKIVWYRKLAGWLGGWVAGEVAGSLARWLTMRRAAWLARIVWYRKRKLGGWLAG